MRHLTTEERATIRRIVDEAGAVEVIRLLAQIVAHDTADLEKANQHRAELMATAKRIAQPE